MRKIFYVPGLIRALLIPVLFWYYGSQGFIRIYSDRFRNSCKNQKKNGTPLPALNLSETEITKRLLFNPIVLSKISNIMFLN